MMISSGNRLVHFGKIADIASLARGRPGAGAAGTAAWERACYAPVARIIFCHSHSQYRSTPVRVKAKPVPRGKLGCNADTYRLGIPFASEVCGIFTIYVTLIVQIRKDASAL
jgi:hypothetical protein